MKKKILLKNLFLKVGRKSKLIYSIVEKQRFLEKELFDYIPLQSLFWDCARKKGFMYRLETTKGGLK